MRTQPLSGLLPQGSIVGDRYRVERYIATGGFGDVYAASHLVLENRVALKVLKVERLTARDAARHVGAFLDEARILAKLRHPHIVSVLDAGVIPTTTQPWIALEWTEGQSLRDAMGADPRPMTVRQAWALMAPVADALAHAHARGIIHRDVKPSNLMLAQEGGRTSLRLLDFGIAKLAASEITATDASRSTGPLSGFTPGYAAPEQITASPTGPWTDVHALALVMVELVNGRPAYDPQTPLESALSDRRPALDPTTRDPALDTVLARALARDPRLRFSDMKVFATSLDQALGLASASTQTSGAPHYDSGPPKTVVALSHPPLGMAVDSRAPRAPSLETAPTSSAVVRDASAPHPKPTRRAPLLVSIALATLGLLAASGWLVSQRLGHGERTATRGGSSAEAASPSASVTAPNTPTSPKSPGGRASSFGPPSKTAPGEGAVGIVHHARRFASVTRDDLSERLLNGGFSVVSSEGRTESNGMDVIMVNGNHIPEGSVAPVPDCVFNIQLQRRSSADEAEHWAAQSAAPLTDWYFAVDGTVLLQLSTMKADAHRFAECERALLDTIAPLP